MDYERVLVCGAHPDDEVAMAGTIAKLSEKGVQVFVLIFTDGCEGYPKPELKEEIVEIRRREQEVCDRILGVHRRICLERPDMALENDKETFLECVRIIREVRPDAIFTHGPYDRHRDHRAVSAITVEARWQAGEPVSAELGPPWHTPHLYYYRGVQALLPRVVVDVSETAHKRWEAMAAYESQHTLWGRTKEEFAEEAERVRESGERYIETFWIAEETVFSDFPPKEEDI